MFILSASVFALLLALGGFGASSWKASACLFWVRVLYSLTTVPFFLFTLPVLSTVLTHAKPTGFNRFGSCVPFKVQPREEKSARAASGLEAGGGPSCTIEDGGGYGDGGV